MKSDFFRVSIARGLMSPRFPIGVETIYRPFFMILITSISILLVSCAPVNNISINKTIKIKNNSQDEQIITDVVKKENLVLDKEPLNKKKHDLDLNTNIKKNITIILSKTDNPETVRQFINVVELAVYQKKLKNISFEIKLYENNEDLNFFLNNSDLSGKIFIGPLNTKDTISLKDFCDDGAIFFSFSSKKNLATDCVFLVNFFPANEIRALFNFFPNNSKIALLYPENEYGFGINKIIDPLRTSNNQFIHYQKLMEKK